MTEHMKPIESPKVELVAMQMVSNPTGPRYGGTSESIIKAMKELSPAEQAELARVLAAAQEGHNAHPKNID